MSSLPQSHTEEIYLCQVNERLSCGACCGLYNRADLSRHTLETALGTRTETFLKTDRTMDSILDFGRKIATAEAVEKPYPDFHHCPYIGLVGTDSSRVGCLLHPQSAGNNGVDFRGLSYYGGMACNTYFCPASQHLNPEIKRIVQHAADNWYDYGLIITEKTLLEAFFKELGQRLPFPLSLAQISGNTDALAAVSGFLHLKTVWPFRPKNGRGPCHYFFKDLKYRKPPVAYRNCPPFLSPYHTIFQELVSAFDSVDELKDAEAMVDALIQRIAQCLA